MRKVIVTGGAGFIGSHLVDSLIKQNIKVIILDNCSTGKTKNINPKACYMNLDITTIDPKSLLNEETDIDTIFHLAAKTTVQESIDKPKYYNRINVGGTLNILELAKNLNVKRVIFSSSSSVYGNAKTPTSETHPLNPLSPYALNKLIGEQYCKLYSEVYNIDTVCLRYFNVYGDRMSNKGYKLVFPILVAKHSNNFKGDIYNVGNGENYSINEIADMFSGKKQYGNKVIEPFETLAEIAKIDLDLDFKPKDILKEWIKNYKN